MLPHAADPAAAREGGRRTAVTASAPTAPIIGEHRGLIQGGNVPTGAGERRPAGSGHTGGPRAGKGAGDYSFSDFVGSTVRAAELGDAQWRELLAEHHGRVRRQLARFRGVELDTAGDGFFARFDGPARAIRCALAIREVVRELGLQVALACTRASARCWIAR